MKIDMDKNYSVDTESLIIKYDILLQMVTELSQGKTESFIKHLCLEKLEEVKAVDNERP